MLALDAGYSAAEIGALTAVSAVSQMGIRLVLLPHRYDVIVPDLRSGHTVVVTAHSNSLRALVAHVGGLSEQEVLALNIPTGMPPRYDLDVDLVPTVRGGEYLEPQAAAAAAAVVADKGR